MTNKKRERVKSIQISITLTEGTLEMLSEIRKKGGFLNLSETIRYCINNEYHGKNQQD